MIKRRIKIAKVNLDNYAGTKINHLTAIRPGEDYITKDSRHKTRWWYMCDCQKLLPEEKRQLKLILVSRVKNGQYKSCGCSYCRNIDYKPEDLRNQRFGNLVAHHIVQRPSHLKTSGTYWYCNCDCGGFNIVRCSDLKRLRVTSCGHCPKNTYDLTGEYGIGYTSNGKKFLFDKEDYSAIKSYTWVINSDGYVFAYIKRIDGKQKYLYMHRLVMGLDEKDDYVVDHRYHNKNDNRKEQLRITTVQNNNRNAVLAKNNTSGVTGVCWDKLMNQWKAEITIDYKTIILGYSLDFNKAVEIRKHAEEKYFKEYSYDNSMKEDKK